MNITMQIVRSYTNGICKIYSHNGKKLISGIIKSFLFLTASLDIIDLIQCIFKRSQWTFESNRTRSSAYNTAYSCLAGSYLEHALSDILFQESVLLRKTNHVLLFLL